MSKENLVTERISKYEEQQKRKLVQLGNSKKSYNNILSYLESEIKQSTQMAEFSYQILCFRDDGVYQLNRAIEEIYGVSSSKEQSNISGEKESISTIDIKLSDGTRIKVLYGRIDISDAGEDAHIWIGYDPDTNRMIVTGKCEFRFSTLIDDIIEKTKYLIETESIYRNQAIEINDDAGYPSVLDLQGIDKEFIVLSDEVKYSLIPLDARINKTEECISKGIPIRYGALLEGAYGG